MLLPSLVKVWGNAVLPGEQGAAPAGSHAGEGCGQSPCPLGASQGAAAVLPWHRWGGSETPFCCATQLGDESQPVPPERVCYLGQANAALARSCGPRGCRHLGSASQQHRAQKSPARGEAAPLGIATKARCTHHCSPRREREGAPCSSHPVLTAGEILGCTG